MVSIKKDDFALFYSGYNVFFNNVKGGNINMEDIIKEVLGNALESHKTVEESYKPFAQAIIRYAERKDLKEQELYIMVNKIISDMEESNPLLKKSKDIATKITGQVKEMVEDTVPEDDVEEQKIKEQIVETCENINDMIGRIIDEL